MEWTTLPGRSRFLIKLAKKFQSRGWSKPQPPEQKGSQMKPREVVRYKVTLV